MSGLWEATWASAISNNNHELEYEPIPQLLTMVEEEEEGEEEEFSADPISADKGPSKTLPSRHKRKKPQHVVMDTYRYRDMIPEGLLEEVQDNVMDEITNWVEIIQKGKPLPRLVAVQGDVDELTGIEPIYRDCLDYQPDLTPWTPTVQLLRDILSNTLAQPLNHAVICCYRHGEDYFSENSCPTLDLSDQSNIVILSLGAIRTMLLRPKRLCAGERRPSPRPTTKVRLRHGSVLCLGPKTNRLMTHEIKRNSQYYRQKHFDETNPQSSLYDEIRVCITFRHVATFQQTDSGKVFGKGASMSTLGLARSVDPLKRAAVIKKMQTAFEKESRHMDFDTKKYYGAGFDVVPFQYLASSLQDIPFDPEAFVGQAPRLEPTHNTAPTLLEVPLDIGTDTNEVPETDIAPLLISSEVADSEEFVAVVTPGSVAAVVDVIEERLQSDSEDRVPKMPDFTKAGKRETVKTGEYVGKEDSCNQVSPQKCGEVAGTDNPLDCLVLSSLDRVDEDQSFELFVDTTEEERENRTPVEFVGGERKSAPKNVEDHPSQSIFAERSALQETLQCLGATQSLSRTYSDFSIGKFEKLTTFERKKFVPMPRPDERNEPPVQLPSPASNGFNGICLLALDLQNDFLGEDPSFFFGKLGSPIAPRRAALLDRINTLAKEVRHMGGVVYFVKSHYGAWSSPQSHNSGRLTQPGAHVSQTACCSVNSTGAGLHPEVEMLIVKQDVILIKEWYSAFMGTALDAQLRRLRVGTIVCCGVTTNHSVAATVRSAANLGYNVILSSDGTAQIDPRLQARSEQKLKRYTSMLLLAGQQLSNYVKADPCVVDENDRKAENPKEPEPKKSIEIDALARLSGFGAGDSIIIPAFLDSQKADFLYETMKPGPSSHIDWRESIDENGNLVASTALQVEPNSDGHLPVYRGDVPVPWERGFKADSFSDQVGEMKTLAEDQTGHQLNFGRIMCFRSGADGTGWDADKNLDVRDGSFVAAVSLGGDRMLELKPKKESSSLAPQRVLLQHNSLLLLGPETTRNYVHKVPTDENATKPHLQITFLDIATYFSRPDSRLGVPALYGQGTEFSNHDELQEAQASSRMMEKLGITMAGFYTLTTLPPGTQGLGLSIACTAVATAATAMWFQIERKKAWREHQLRLFQFFQDSVDEPMSLEEARHRILNHT